MHNGIHYDVAIENSTEIIVNTINIGYIHWSIHTSHSTNTCIHILRPV